MAKCNIIGPDDIFISPTNFNTYKEAIAYLSNWIASYQKQGFYSAACGIRIPLTEIRSYCILVDVFDDPKNN
jgi:hypothetical protein